MSQAATAAAVRNPLGSLCRTAPPSSLAPVVVAGQAAYQLQSRFRTETLITWQRAHWAQCSRHSAAALTHVSVPRALSFQEPREPDVQLPSPYAVVPQWPGCARANHLCGLASGPACVVRRCLDSSLDSGASE